MESEDTDVLLLCMFLFLRLNKYVVKRGCRYIHLYSVVRRLAEKCDDLQYTITASLIPAFALIGCGTMSYPFRRWEKTTAKTTVSSPISMETFPAF